MYLLQGGEYRGEKDYLWDGIYHHVYVWTADPVLRQNRYDQSCECDRGIIMYVKLYKKPCGE